VNEDITAMMSHRGTALERSDGETMCFEVIIGTAIRHDRMGPFSQDLDRQAVFAWERETIEFATSCG
jgi:hypothetical protein